MSTLTESDLQKIANLAKLELPDTLLPTLTKNVDDILHLVAKMDQTDTDNIKPLAHPVDATQPMRADIVTEPDQHKRFQENAPQVEAGLYIVPKFIETE